MPLRIKTRCRAPGCTIAVRGRYCTEHARQAEARRGTPRERGYDRAWVRLAALRRQLDHYLCQECLKAERLTESKLVDHIVPIHVRPEWRLALENTQVLCSTCHKRKSDDDSRRYGSSTQRTLTSEQIAARKQVAQLDTAQRD